MASKTSLWAPVAEPYVWDRLRRMHLAASENLDSALAYFREMKVVATAIVNCDADIPPELQPFFDWLDHGIRVLEICGTSAAQIRVPE